MPVFLVVVNDGHVTPDRWLLVCCAQASRELARTVAARLDLFDLWSTTDVDVELLSHRSDCWPAPWGEA